MTYPERKTNNYSNTNIITIKFDKQIVLNDIKAAKKQGGRI